MKTKQILLGITFIFSLMFSNSIVAQDNFDASKITSEWKLFKELDGLKFYVQELPCSQPSSKKDLIYLALKIENTTNHAASMDYNFSLIYDEECSGCDVNGEYRYSATIEANSSIEGNCGNQGIGLDRLIINPNLSPGWKLRSIDIKNINIK